MKHLKFLIVNEEVVPLKPEMGKITQLGDFENHNKTVILKFKINSKSSDFENHF